MEVEFEDRRDNDTIICRVKWTDSRTDEWLVAFVLVRATLDEVQSIPKTEWPELADKVALPHTVRQNAIIAAEALAWHFSQLSILTEGDDS